MRALQFVVSFLLAGVFTAGSAANPSIGLALAKGSFRLDGATVRGNTTLFEGSQIETAAVASELRLNSGVRMVLGVASLGRVHRDRLVLEKGRGRLSQATGYRVEALGLQIFPGSAAIVSLDGPGRLHVAALGGPVRVAKTDGVTVASLAPGSALDFEPQVPGATPASVLTGVLQKKNGQYLLTDETSGVTVEVTGADLEDKVGSRVEVTGAIDPAAKAAAGASQVLRVITIKVLGPGRRPAAVGLTGKQKAIIAGVVIGASATGAAVIATRGKEEKPPLSP